MALGAPVLLFQAWCASIRTQAVPVYAQRCMVMQAKVGAQAALWAPMLLSFMPLSLDCCMFASVLVEGTPEPVPFF